MWGCIATGLFAEPTRTRIAFGEDLEHFGWFYGGSDLNLLLAELCGILFIVAWTVGVMGPFFVMLNYCGLFRADVLEELAGLDESRHKGSVYDDSGKPTSAQRDALLNSRHGSSPGSSRRGKKGVNQLELEEDISGHNSVKLNPNSSPADGNGNQPGAQEEALLP